MNIVIEANDALLSEIKQYYYDSLDFSNAIPHTKFVVTQDNLKVIAYNSNKVMFQGKEAKKQAAMWQETNQAQHIKNNCNCIIAGIEVEHIGSDEVGTGDYFGPVVVCASYVNQEITNQVSEFNIKDSKRLTDIQIKEIANKIKDIVPHYVYVLDNTKYNKAITEGNNANMIKAKMHNFSLLKLINQINKKPLVVVDQFCSKENYYNYLSSTETVLKDICFETKAEDKFLAVAISAIIARDTFLSIMDEYSKDVGFKLQKGAGSKVNEQAYDIVNTFGYDYLNKIAKIHFSNTLKIKEMKKQ